jgi:hypothetical protein
MWNVVQFPRARVRDRSSGVRAALVTGCWCIERLQTGDIIGRTRMPSRADAERIAARISRRDKTALLPTCQPRRPNRAGSHHTPDDAA